MANWKKIRPSTNVEEAPLRSNPMGKGDRMSTSDQVNWQEQGNGPWFQNVQKDISKTYQNAIRKEDPSALVERLSKEISKKLSQRKRKVSP